MKSAASRRGASTILELIVTMTLLVFFSFFPVEVSLISQKRMILSEVWMVALQDAAQEGQVDGTVMNNVDANLTSNGLDPSQVKIVTNAPSGNPIVMGSTTPIQVTLYYPATTDVQIMNALSALIGEPNLIQTVHGTAYYVFSGETMSSYAPY